MIHNFRVWKGAVVFFSHEGVEIYSLFESQSPLLGINNGSLIVIKLL